MEYVAIASAWITIGHTAAVWARWIREQTTIGEKANKLTSYHHSEKQGGETDICLILFFELKA